MNGLFRKWQFSAADVTKIEIAKVTSLVDEIGITVHADNAYFITDADENSMKVAKLLNFSSLFGDDWYRRVEGGECLVWKCAGDEA